MTNGREVRRRVAVVVIQAAILGLLAWLAWVFFRRLDLVALRARLDEVGGMLILAMTLGLLARLPIWTERWLVAVGSAGLRAGRLRSLGALAASMAVNTVTPTARVAGGFVRARYLADDARCSFGVAYGTVVVDQIAHHAALAVFSSLAVAMVAGEHLPGWTGPAALGALAAGLVAGGVLWLRRRHGTGEPLVDRLLARTRRSLDRQAARQPRLAAALAGGGEALSVVARLLREPSVLVAGVLLGAALLLVNGVVQWLAFQALELPVGLPVAVAVVGVGGFAGVAAGTPGGAGGAEAGMIAMLAALGVSTVDATVATLLFRGLHYAVTLGCGLPALAVLEWRHGAMGRATRS